MDISRQLDINKATIHFWIDKRWAPANLIPGKIELLSRIVDYGTEFGITVCIENLTERSDSFAPAFEAVPELRMTLDIGHAQLLAKKNTSFGFIEDYFSRIAHMHVHDNNGGTSVKDDLHLPLGDGTSGLYGHYSSGHERLRFNHHNGSKAQGHVLNQKGSGRLY